MGEWYKSFYMTTDVAEAELKKAILDPVNRADVEKRLGEIKALPKGRCVISDLQAQYLEKILTETKGESHDGNRN